MCWCGLHQPNCGLGNVHILQAFDSTVTLYLNCLLCSCLCCSLDLTSVLQWSSSLSTSVVGSWSSHVLPLCNWTHRCSYCMVGRKSFRGLSVSNSCSWSVMCLVILSRVLYVNVDSLLITIKQVLYVYVNGLLITVKQVFCMSGSECMFDSNC